MPPLAAKKLFNIHNGYFLSEHCKDMVGPVVQPGMPYAKWAKEHPVCKAYQPTRPEGRGFESRPVHHYLSEFPRFGNSQDSSPFFANVLIAVRGISKLISKTAFS